MAVEFSPGGRALAAYGGRGVPNAAQTALATRNTVRVSADTGFGSSGAGSSGGGSGTKAEIDAVADLITKLREEQQLMLETDPVRAELAKHRKVLAEATAGERAEIEQLIAAEIQLKAAREAADFLGRESLDFLQGIVRGGDEAANAVKKLANALIDAALQALWLGKGPLAGLFGVSGSIFSGLFGGGRAGTGSLGLPSPFADGGMIHGAGGGTDDKVPIWASAGEFMVNARSTARYRPVLERINAGHDIPGLAAGGMIGGAGFGGAGAGPGFARSPSNEVAIKVDVSGARGDRDIEERVAAGVQAGLTMFRREVQPLDVKRIMGRRGVTTG